jgi:hypothetical protein
MKYCLVPRLFSMMGVWLLLLSWGLGADLIGPAGHLLSLLLIAVPLAMSGAEAVFYKRHAFRNQYLTGPSWLYRLMGLEPLIFTVEIIKALGLAALLMVATLALQLREWALLLLNVFVLALLMPRLPGLLHRTVRPTYLHVLSRRLAIWVSTALLWLQSLLVLALDQNDDYRGLTWTEAVEYSIAPTASSGGDDPVSIMLRIDAGVQGLSAWAGYRLLHGEPAPAQTLAAVLVVGAVAALWFLLAWAFSRALIGVMARPLAIWRPRPRQRDDGDVFETWWL